MDFNSSFFEGYNAIGMNTEIYNCSFGYGSYVGPNSSIGRAKIGRYCAIGSRVSIINGRHPSSLFVSIHPAFYSTARQAGFTYVKENRFDEYRYLDKQNGITVRIGNDVWIGYGASVLEGVSIADGTIVAAGAVVTKDTEPYSIVGGVPAKTIGFRFDKDEIDFLLRAKWWDLAPKELERIAETFNDIDSFMACFYVR